MADGQNPFLSELWLNQLKEVLGYFEESTDLYLHPNIPAKKEANARNKCAIPAEETLWGLIDCTVFGSAKNCLVFATQAIDFHNDWAATQPGAFKIPYQEFPSKSFSILDEYEISLGTPHSLNMSGSSCDKAILVNLLQTLRTRVLMLLELYPSEPSAADQETTDPNGLESLILTFLHQLPRIPAFYIQGNIPETKRRNAWTSCQLPENEKMLALLDSTVFGSAKNCLVIGTLGIYFHNDWTSDQTGTFFISYAEFSQMQFETVSFAEINLSPNYSFNISGCTCPKDTILALLTDLAASIQRDNSMLSGQFNSSVGGKRCPACGCILREIQMSGKPIGRTLCLNCRPTQGVCPCCRFMLSNKQHEFCQACGANWQQPAKIN